MGSQSTESQTLLELYRLLQAADRLAQSLPTHMQSRLTDDIAELYSRLLEDIVKQHNPRTTEDVRALAPEQRGQGIIYLIDQHLRGREPESVPFWKVDGWKEWLHDLGGAGHAEKLLLDVQVRTPEDVFGWFCRQDRQLFPKVKTDQDDNDGGLHHSTGK